MGIAGSFHDLPDDAAVDASCQVHVDRKRERSDRIRAVPSGLSEGRQIQVAAAAAPVINARAKASALRVVSKKGA